MIRRKILEKVATLSTWSELHTDDDSRSNGSDSLVVTNASDADSSGSTKVAADSVDGDEDLVNITKESTDGSNPPVPYVLQCLGIKSRLSINIVLQKQIPSV